MNNDRIQKLTHNQILELNELLYSAIISNDLSEVKHLIEKGADIHCDYLVKSNYRSNPMECAIMINSTEMLNLLIEKGSQFHISNSSPLILAINKNRLECVEILLKKKCYISYDALVIATNENNYKAIEMLLDYCTDMQRLTLIAMTENKPEMKSWLLNTVSKRELKNKLDDNLEDSKTLTHKIKI